MDSCSAVDRELEKVAKQFEGISDHFERTITNQIDFINDLKKQFETAGGAEYELTQNEVSVLREAVSRVEESVGGIAADHRVFHSSVSKIGKSIDRNFKPEYNAITRHDIIGGDRAKLLTQAVGQHLYRDGLFNIGEHLCRESNISLETKDKEPYIELHRILNSLRKRDLEPAFQWVNNNKDELMARGSSLEFKLHRLVFLSVVQKGSKFQSEAISYARNNFANCVPRYEKEIQELMGSLLFTPGNSKTETENKSPYSHLFDHTLWDDIQESFTRDAFFGQTVDSPLAMCFEAGCTALPALLDIRQVIQTGPISNIWNGRDELPIEIELGKELRFHSVFACPILRQQTTESNPPMRLVCGHVISKDALLRLKLSNGNKLKCPYCPKEQNITDARRLTF